MLNSLKNGNVDDFYGNQMCIGSPDPEYRRLPCDECQDECTRDCEYYKEHYEPDPDTMRGGHDDY